MIDHVLVSHQYRKSAVKLLPSDAILLQAILFGCGSSSITFNSILNTILSLGSELPTFVEFDGGLARLAAAGFIVFDQHRVTPTSMSLRLAEEITCPVGSADHFLQQLQANLASHSCQSQSSGAMAMPAAYTTGFLTAAAYDNAFA